MNGKKYEAIALKALVLSYGMKGILLTVRLAKGLARANLIGA